MVRRVAALPYVYAALGPALDTLPMCGWRAAPQLKLGLRSER